MATNLTTLNQGHESSESTNDRMVVGDAAGLWRPSAGSGQALSPPRGCQERTPIVSAADQHGMAGLSCVGGLASGAPVSPGASATRPGAPRLTGQRVTASPSNSLNSSSLSPSPSSFNSISSDSTPLTKIQDTPACIDPSAASSSLHSSSSFMFIHVHSRSFTLNKNTPTPRLRRAGFTLLEMVIVFAMLAAVMAVIFSFNNVVLRNIKEMNIEVKRGREGPAILRVIENDLISAYADGRMEKMFSGESGQGSTEIRFVSSRDSQLFLGGVNSDITETGYRISRNRSGGTRELYTLWRREDFSLDENPLEGGVWMVVAENVIDFQMEFYDLPDEGIEDSENSLADLVLGSDMVEAQTTWDDTLRRLPYAIRIDLSIDNREGEDRFNPELEADGIQHFSGFVRLPPYSRELPEAEDAIQMRLNPRPQPPTEGGNNAPGNGSGN